MMASCRQMIPTFQRRPAVAKKWDLLGGTGSGKTTILQFPDGRTPRDDGDEENVPIDKRRGELGT